MSLRKINNIQCKRYVFIFFWSCMFYSLFLGQDSSVLFNQHERNQCWVIFLFLGSFKFDVVKTFM